MPGISYVSFHDEIDQVLHMALETDTVLELNTRRLSNRAVLDELYPIYKRYYELGGRYVFHRFGCTQTRGGLVLLFLVALDFADCCVYT